MPKRYLAEEVNWEPFAQLIERLGQERGLTQAQIAEQADISASTMSRLLNAGRVTDARQVGRPAFRDVVAVGMVLGLAPNDIARLLGLWPAAEEGGEETDPTLRGLVTDLQQIEPPSRRQTLTEFLVRAIAAERQKP